MQPAIHRRQRGECVLATSEHAAVDWPVKKRASAHDVPSWGLIVGRTRRGGGGRELGRCLRDAGQSHAQCFVPASHRFAIATTPNAGPSRLESTNLAQQGASCRTSSAFVWALQVARHHCRCPDQTIGPTSQPLDRPKRIHACHRSSAKRGYRRAASRMLLPACQKLHQPCCTSTALLESDRAQHVSKPSSAETISEAKSEHAHI